MANILSTNERSRNGINEHCICIDYDTPNEEVTVATPSAAGNVLIRGMFHFEKNQEHLLELLSGSNVLLPLDLPPIGLFESFPEPLFTHRGEAFRFRCNKPIKITFKIQVDG